MNTANKMHSVNGKLMTRAQAIKFYQVELKKLNSRYNERPNEFLYNEIRSAEKSLHFFENVLGR